MVFQKDIIDFWVLGGRSRPDPQNRRFPVGPKPMYQKPCRAYVGELNCKSEFWSVLGRFPATVGHGIVTNGPASQNAAQVNTHDPGTGYKAGSWQIPVRKQKLISKIRLSVQPGSTNVGSGRFAPSPGPPRDPQTKKKPFIVVGPGENANLLYVTQYCFRAGNRSSGPD